MVVPDSIVSDQISDGSSESLHVASWEHGKLFNFMFQIMFIFGCFSKPLTPFKLLIVSDEEEGIVVSFNGLAIQIIDRVCRRLLGPDFRNCVPPPPLDLDDLEMTEIPSEVAKQYDFSCRLRWLKAI